MNPRFKSMACNAIAEDARPPPAGATQRSHLPERVAPLNYWLMKSEPAEFSLDDLARRPGRIEPWDGVRNYQARNMLRDAMAEGDQAFFYHSNCEEPGIVGIVSIVGGPRPDPTAFDRRHKHFDPKSDPASPRWFLRDVRFHRRLARQISLAELKTHAHVLEGLPLLRKGNRLSVMPVTPDQWDYILGLERR